MTVADRTIGEFLDDIASENVTPAGGTAAAIGGATGAALCETVCIHTIERDGPADGETELAEIRTDLGTQRAHLLDLAERDAEVVAAFGEGSSAEVTETVTKRAAGIPLTIAQASLTVVEHATVVTEEGSPNAVADAVTGAFLAHSALEASLFTVRANLESIPDEGFVAEMEERAADIETRAETAFERVEANANSTS
jgi:formiminotetrahydrofolate cyclodeaminase